MKEKQLGRFRWWLGLANMVAWKDESSGRGVALFWRKDLDVSLRSYGRRHVDVDVVNEEGLVWRLTGIYGESATERKKETWKMMRILKQQHQSGRPWLCLGDFNEILASNEKRGGAECPQRYMNDFRDALDFCELRDIGFEGDMYTWRNHSRQASSYICERLDHATANSDWCAAFPHAVVRNGDPRHSDHRPIIVYMEGADRGWRRSDHNFRFEARWLQEDGCEEVIKKAWDRGFHEERRGVAGAPESVAGDMTKWSREVVGELEGRIKETRSKLDICMKAPTSEAKVKEEASLRIALASLKEKKYTKLTQRAHMWWLRGWNKNIKYLQSVASARNSANKLKEICREDGSVVEEGQALTNYDVATNNAPDDRFLTHGSSFSSRKAYSLLSSDHEIDLNAGYIWSSKAPIKLRIFGWLLCHDRLSTMANLHHKTITSHPDCPRCTTYHEGALHISILCPYALQVWALLGLHPPHSIHRIWETTTPVGLDINI
ncbi:Elongation factor 1-alpha [Hordeum vulgare]|nr:Elongation factor 1-alpha [Hordeum vulgare]